MSISHNRNQKKFSHVPQSIFSGSNCVGQKPLGQTGFQKKIWCLQLSLRKKSFIIYIASPLQSLSWVPAPSATSFPSGHFVHSELVPPELYEFLGQGTQPSSESTNCPGAQASNSRGVFFFYIFHRNGHAHTVQYKYIFKSLARNERYF